MKKIISILLIVFTILTLCACGQNDSATDSTTKEKTTETTAEAKYKDSKYLGKWYNADTTDEMLIYEFLADGTAIYEGTHKGTWVDNGDDITIMVKKGKKDVTMTGYFVISGDGFVARATPENQHYLDDGEGELQLEIMLTENTCIDCIKKDKKS